jgi:hypothetical protein
MKNNTGAHKPGLFRYIIIIGVLHRIFTGFGRLGIILLNDV